MIPAHKTHGRMVFATLPNNSKPKTPTDMNGPTKSRLSISKTTKLLLTPKTTHSQYQSLLIHYGVTQSLTKTKILHAHIITSGRLSTEIRSALAATYAHCGYVPNARKLFEDFPERDTRLCNFMIKMYINKGDCFEAMKVFVEMLQSNICCADNYTFPFVIKACSELLLVEYGRVVHGLTLVSGFGSHMIVLNSLLAMYMNCGEVEEAKKFFDAMEEKSVVSWNTMINGYFKNGFADAALVVFKQMVDSGVEIDGASMVAVLPACGYLKELEVGKRVHGLVEEKGLGKKIVSNALVDMYVKCRSMDEARLVFDNMVERDVVSWTSMINGYILNGDPRSAILLFKIMQIEGLRPNSVTIALILLACASLNNLKDGRCLHGWVIKQRLDSEVVVETSLIDMYAKCHFFGRSYSVFKRTSRKKTVPWNAMLSGCLHNDRAIEAIELFKQMLMEGVEINEATFNSLLPAYGLLADLQPVNNINSYLTKSGLVSNIQVATSLIDIYSKSGGLESAHKVFNDIPIDVKDIFVWSIIIAGYGMHGHGETAVSLFKQMVQSGVKPNDVTFTSVLQSCSHAGLVDEGLYLLKFMLKDHQTAPNDDHYTCIVDLLGRAGRLDEAYDLIKTMPFMPSHVIWGALLGACVIHENVELGEIAAKWLFELEPDNTGNYVLLAKLYAAVGRWEDAENVRHRMDDIGLKKAPAHSLIGVRTV